MVGRMTDTTENEWLTSTAVAQMLGVNRQTVLDLARRGDVPSPYWVGVHARWRRQHIEDWLETRRAPTRDELPRVTKPATPERTA